MIRPCIVVFPPGAGGYFVGNISQFLISGDTFSVNNNGSCHNGNVVYWDIKVPLNNSAESISNEIAAIHQTAPDTDRVVVTHLRHVHESSKYFNLTIWISFTIADIESMAEKYRLKNKNIIYRQNYDNIKDSSWPDYEEFLKGNVSDTIKQEVFEKIFKETYYNWTWFVPRSSDHNIFELPYSTLIAPSDNDILKFCKFLQPNVNNTQVNHVRSMWKEYLDKQTITK